MYFFLFFCLGRGSFFALATFSRHRCEHLASCAYLDMSGVDRSRNNVDWRTWDQISGTSGERCGNQSNDVLARPFYRLPWHGGSKMYACWVDESQNMTLRDLARFAHRRSFEYRVFGMLRLQALLRSGVAWLGLVSGSSRRRSQR